MSFVTSVLRMLISDEVWLVDMIAPQPRPIERMKGFFGEVEEPTPNSGMTVTVLGTLTPKNIATDENTYMYNIMIMKNDDDQSMIQMNKSTDNLMSLTEVMS